MGKSTCLSTVYCETGVRGASSEAGASLEQQSNDFIWKINVFCKTVLLAAMRSASREAPLEKVQEQEQEQEQEQ